MAEHDIDTNLGMSRRTLIKRGAILGGTLVWAAPAISTIGKAAAAGGSPQCGFKIIAGPCNGPAGSCTQIGFGTFDPDCCNQPPDPGACVILSITFFDPADFLSAACNPC